MQSPGRATPTPSDDAVMSIWPLNTRALAQAGDVGGVPGDVAAQFRGVAQRGQGRPGLLVDAEGLEDLVGVAAVLGVDPGQAGVGRVGRGVTGQVVLDPVLAPQVDRAVEQLRLVLLAPAQQCRRRAGVRAATADVELAGDGPVGVPAVDDLAGPAVRPQDRGAPRLAVAVDQPAAVALAGGADAEDLVRADGAVDQGVADRLGRGDPHLLHVLLGQVRLRVGDRLEVRELGLAHCPAGRRSRP